ncbi:MAG: hypothetical protein PHE70_05565 [Tepidanaerobacteraceae bacterium]|nr:hypothetical protein [Tepidanaerobacteraceae bacterium]
MDLRISDIKLRINFFFIVIIAAALIAGLYREIIAALLALSVHECAHIFIGKELGLKIEELELSPFGGRIKVILDDTSSEAEMLTALAGPFANFVTVGVIIFLLKQKFISAELSEQLIHYQLMLGFFNIIPAFPLDGGRIFALWLRQHVSYTSSVRIASKMGKILAIVLLAIGILGLTFKRVFVSLFIASFFLFYQATMEEKNVVLIFMNQLIKKKQIILKKKYILGEFIIVVEDTPVKEILYLFSPQKYFVVLIMDENMSIKNYLTETEIFDKILEKGLELNMKDLI